MPAILSIVAFQPDSRNEIGFLLLKRRSIILHNEWHVIRMNNVVPGSSDGFFNCLSCVGKPGFVPIADGCHRVCVDNENKHRTIISEVAETFGAIPYCLLRIFY